MLELLSTILILFGATIALIGSIGLARFPDIFTRLHGPTKATTLGVGSVLLGTIIFLMVQDETGAIRQLLITVFLFLTAPVSAHLLSKVALHRRCHSVCELPEKE
jgi:multicomponent K+:H+ antiporter subunit G